MGLRTQRRCPWASLTHVRLRGCHHVGMADPMSLAWQQAVDSFAEHLRDERNRSVHTVRAYLADVNDLVGFCVDRDIESPAQLALPTLRAWLADATQEGLVTKTLMKKLRRELLKKIDSNTVVVFFFAGHGAEYDGKQYLLPQDWDEDDPRALEDEAMQLQETLKQIGRCFQSRGTGEDETYAGWGERCGSCSPSSTRDRHRQW